MCGDWLSPGEKYIEIESAHFQKKKHLDFDALSKL